MAKHEGLLLKIDFKGNISGYMQENNNKIPIENTTIKNELISFSEEDFEESYEFVKNIHFYETHIFKYSRRHGTKAAAMDGQLTEAVKAQRSEKMLKLHEIRAKEYETAMIGRTLELLLEEEVEIGGKTYFMAHSKEYVRAVIEKTDAHKVNDLVKAKAVDFADEHVLLAICEDLY